MTPYPPQGLTAVDFTDDSSLIAGGFADSSVRVWSVTPKKLRKVKSAAGRGQLLSLVAEISDSLHPHDSLAPCWFLPLQT